MPYQAIVPVTEVWTAVTNGPVASLTFQNRGSTEIEILPAEGQTGPAPQGLMLPRGTALVNRRMSDLFPGEVTSSATLWARTYPKGRAYAFVSHI